jgi:hypothetical protein
MRRSVMSTSLISQELVHRNTIEHVQHRQSSPSNPDAVPVGGVLAPFLLFGLWPDSPTVSNMGFGTATDDLEVPIGGVDVWQLPRQVRWSIMRALAREHVEQVELRRYVRALLATGAWRLVRVVARTDKRHVYDLFGVPSNAGSHGARRAIGRNTI